MDWVDGVDLVDLVDWVDGVDWVDLVDGVGWVDWVDGVGWVDVISHPDSHFPFRIVSSSCSSLFTISGSCR